MAVIENKTFSFIYMKGSAMRKHIFHIRSKLIPLQEICLGLVFLIQKIDSIYIYNQFLDKLPDGIKELISYELIRYGDLLLWSVSILTGCVYWTNKKIYWIFTQLFLCLLVSKVALSLFVFYDIRVNSILSCVLLLFCIGLFLLIECTLFRVKEIGNVLITAGVKSWGTVIAVIGCTIYIFLEIMDWFL